MRCSRVSGSLNPRQGAGLSRVQGLQRQRGRLNAVHPHRDERPRLRPPDHLPDLGTRRAEPLSRCVRLSRPLDDRPSTRGHHHPVAGPALLNNDLTLRLADRLGERLRREAGDDVGRQVERAYRLAFGRAPKPRGTRAGQVRLWRVTAYPSLGVPYSTVMNSSTLISSDCGEGGCMDRREFFSWVRNGLGGAALAELLPPGQRQELWRRLRASPRSLAPTSLPRRRVRSTSASSGR